MCMKNDKIGGNPFNGGVCIGTGLVALDVVISVHPGETPITFFAGGSCGNVLTILSYLGWESYPIARLAADPASDILVEDLRRWKVNTELLSFTTDGSTPIIIHRILNDKSGNRKHKFEFRNPEDGKYLPSYKPFLAKSVPEVLSHSPKPSVFYFDRVNRASLDLAKQYKNIGATIIFEPSNMKDYNAFTKCLQVADIVKFSNERLPEFANVFSVGQTLLDIETLGSRGLRYRTKGAIRWIEVPAFEAGGLADAAGSGDWCTAGLIFKLLSVGSSLEKATAYDLNQALLFGQALSALNCNFEGARVAMYNMTADELMNAANWILAEGRANIRPVPARVKVKQPSFSSFSISSLYSEA